MSSLDIIIPKMVTDTIYFKSKVSVTYLELIADLCGGGGDAAGRQFHGIGSFDKNRGKAERLKLGAKTDNLVAAIAKNHIDRELHEKHVHGPALGDDKRVPLWQLFAAKQAFHAGRGIVSHTDNSGNRTLARQVDDHLDGGFGFKNSFA
jgi:hypothetical protein